MKVYADLVISGDARHLNLFIPALERHLANGWSRSFQREAAVRRVALGPMYCFVCTPLSGRPAAELWVATRPDGAIYVSNILAPALSSLTFDQYNAILLDFYEHCVKPAAQEAGTQAELGDPNPQLEDFLSPTAAQLLRRFSSPPRSTNHPLDRQNWNEFLAAAHREHSTLEAEMLRRWLVEEQNWPEDEAIALSLDYERSRDLLRTYESLPA